MLTQISCLSHSASICALLQGYWVHNKIFMKPWTGGAISPHKLTQSQHLYPHLPTHIIYRALIIHPRGDTIHWGGRLLCFRQITKINVSTENSWWYYRSERNKGKANNKKDSIKRLVIQFGWKQTWIWRKCCVMKGHRWQVGLLKLLVSFSRRKNVKIVWWDMTIDTLCVASVQSTSEHMLSLHSLKHWNAWKALLVRNCVCIQLI